MLTLTENASTIIHDLSARPGLPETAGLRISSQVDQAALDGTEAENAPTFAVQAAEQAHPGDQVVEQQGAIVYLDPMAAALLDDKVLDAAVDPQGMVEFALGLQR